MMIPFLKTKKRLGKLQVIVEYTTRYNFSMTVTIRELKLSEPITYEGKSFDVPVGTYTVALKGLMSDPGYQGDYHSVYKGVYGSFERQQKIEVREGLVTPCVFELPSELLPVSIHVVSGDVPIVGAEVLIREVDPNFRVSRKNEGTQFFLGPGTYQVVVTSGNVLMKEAIHVTEKDTKFIVDISQQMVKKAGLVVVRYLDGSMVKGVTEDFIPGGESFTVIQHDEHKVPIQSFEGVKAVFFVKNLEGNRMYDEHKDFALANQFGRKTVVFFCDKEEMCGYTLIGHTDQPQFFLFPVDPKSNNAKVYVIKESVVDIKFG